MIRVSSAVLAALLLAAPAVGAQQLPAGGAARQAALAGGAVPPNLVAGKDPAAAPAGRYDLDSRHVSVLAKASHEGFALTVFRFEGVQGTLDWNPARPEASRVEVTVDTRTTTVNVPGFADLVMGPRFLNAARWPTATFVSRSIRRTGPDTGVIEGDFTLMGVTRPLTLETRLFGAGSNMEGRGAIGFSASGKVNRRAHGMTDFADQVIGDEVVLDIDVEFLKAPA